MDGRGSSLLDTLDDQNNLKEVVQDYRNKVMQLWMWLGPRFEQEHIEAYREMARLEDRIRDIDPKWKSGYGKVYSEKSSST